MGCGASTGQQPAVSVERPSANKIAVAAAPNKLKTIVQGKCGCNNTNHCYIIDGLVSDLWSLPGFCTVALVPTVPWQRFQSLGSCYSTRFSGDYFTLVPVQFYFATVSVPIQIGPKALILKPKLMA